MDGVRHRKRCCFSLHGFQFIQRDCGCNISSRSTLLFPQHGQPVVPLGDIRRHHLQVQAVIEGLQDFFLWVVEIRYLIGGGKEGDCGDGVCTAFVGVFALIKRGQQRVQHTIVTFEDLVQHYNIRFRDLVCGIHAWRSGMELPQRLCIAGELFLSGLKRLGGACITVLLSELLHGAGQVRLQLPVIQILL